MSTTGARHLPKATSKASFTSSPARAAAERDVVVEHLAKGDAGDRQPEIPDAAARAARAHRRRL